MQEAASVQEKGYPQAKRGDQVGDAGLFAGPARPS